MLVAQAGERLVHAEGAGGEVVRVGGAHDVPEGVLIVGEGDGVLDHGGWLEAHGGCRFDDALAQRGVGGAAARVEVGGC